MGRLRAEFLERTESYCDRVIVVCKTLQSGGCFPRIVDQLVGSGTSVGANVFEADEAMTTADFIKCLAIASKELSETRFWLRLVARHDWIRPDRLDGLHAESNEIRKVIGSMIARSKKNGGVRPGR